jgi:hypothetical protein
MTEFKPRPSNPLLHRLSYSGLSSSSNDDGDVDDDNSFSSAGTDAEKQLMLTGKPSKLRSRTSVGAFYFKLENKPGAFFGEMVA